MYTYESELMHHGIKGMHWGIRRFQPYETKGRKSGKKGAVVGKAAKVKSKRRSWDELSEEERDSIKRKIILGAAGVATAAILGTVAYKVGKTYCGYTLKKGTSMERVTSSIKDDTHFDRVYAIKSGKHDRSKYSGMYAKAIRKHEDEVFRHHYKTDKMKIAGVKASKKVTNEMMSDPEVKKYIDEWRDIIKKNWEKDVKSPQQVLNIALTDTGKKGLNIPNTEKVQKMYMDKLKKAGYSGVIDMNDNSVFGKSVSNYYSKKASIIFDTNKMKHVNTIKLTDKEIQRNALKGEISSGIRATGKELAKSQLGISAGVTAAIGVGALAAEEASYQRTKGRKKK